MENVILKVKDLSEELKSEFLERYKSIDPEWYNYDIEHGEGLDEVNVMGRWVLDPEQSTDKKIIKEVVDLLEKDHKLD